MQNCYRSSAGVPHPADVKDQNNRLTTKHIKTLTFLQDLANENKVLKAKVEELQGELAQCGELHELAKTAKDKLEELQAEHMAKVQGSQKDLEETHKKELMKKVQEKYDDEQKWTSERDQLLSEIEKLKEENASLRLQLKNAEQYRTENGILQSRIQVLERKITNKETQSDSLEVNNQTLLIELEKLEQVRKENQDLKDEVQEVNQKSKELQFKIDRLERELSENGYREQDALMQTLKSKLTKLHKERSVLKDQLSDQENKREQLSDENQQLRRALNDSERMRQQLWEEKQGVDQEVELLRRQLGHLQGGSKENFRDFVQLKRQLNATKDENDDLKVRLQYQTKNTALPSLKETGGGGVGAAGGGGQGRQSAGRRRSRDLH